ncbi:hypothetical protein FACS189440_09770 [Bacteroidia bacterium]|nr:hypothetical protein FACS189423_00370 [Bacteroidia bacterium]GHT47861.1 hypothetical protein FACS189440_09770 [Bacteroidia bacterium]
MNQSDQLLEEVKRQFKEIAEQSLIVSILGQTGVGKSSLINALFGTNLATDPIKPCTKEIKEIEVINQEGFKMLFCDLPGLGESDSADVKYFEQYMTQIQQSDIIMWAIHIDNRSVTFDLEVLGKIIRSLPYDKRKKFINSLTFVLTKADMLFQPPWIFALTKSENGIFTIGKELRKLFETKCDYYQEMFLKPYSDLIENITTNDSNYMLDIPNISFNKESVMYQGIMTKIELEKLCGKYPKHANLFNRLYENYRPVYCSSVFKFNLGKVLMLISNKIDGNVAIRMGNFLKRKNIDNLPLSKARELSNMVIFNSMTKQTVFDLTTLNL